MKWQALFGAAALIAAGVGMQTPAHGAEAERPYLFNVLNQRTVAVTAQYWNPILAYVSRKSGVLLELKLTKTGKDSTTIAETGVYDFLYTNRFFTPERDRLGFRVIAKPAGPGIRSMIVVPQDSPVQSLRDLEGKEVAFPTPDSFFGYWLPMEQLLRNRINLKAVFTGNQEATFAQLRINQVGAAGVNGPALEGYARRENFAYRVLWTSEPYGDLCVMANPKVPADKVAAVRTALVNMSGDPEGMKILQASADVLKRQSALAFVAADNHDYDSIRAFYRTTLVKAQK